MIPEFNYLWKCKICGSELPDHRDDKDHRSNPAAAPKCPKCGGEMEGSPIIHGGPFLQNNLFRKY